MYKPNNSYSILLLIRISPMFEINLPIHEINKIYPNPMETHPTTGNAKDFKYSQE